MKPEYKKRIKGALLLTAMAGLVFAIFYGAYAGPWDPKLRRFYEERKNLIEQRRANPPVAEGQFRLVKDQARTVGKLRLVFLGLQRGRIHLDVTLLELDPQRAYRYEFSVKKAQKGFRLAGRPFRLHSHGRSAIIIE